VALPATAPRNDTVLHNVALQPPANAWAFRSGEPAAADGQWDTNHYPPAVVIALRRAGLAREHAHVRAHLAAVGRRFRRRVGITERPLPEFNAQHQPFPLQCLDPHRWSACVAFLLRKALVRRSGGLLFHHADAYVAPRPFFGDAGLDALVVASDHQEGAAANGASINRWWWWARRVDGGVNGATAETVLTGWNRFSAAVHAFFAPHFLRRPRLAVAAGRRYNQFADVAFIPARAFDAALELLQLNTPFATPPEGFVGYLTAVLRAVTPVPWAPFRFSGGCCATLNASELRHAAGHKLRINDSAAFAAATALLDASFECDAPAAGFAFGGVARRDFGVARRAVAGWPPRFYHVAQRTTCRTHASLVVAPPNGTAGAGAVHAQLLAPMSNEVSVNVSTAAQPAAALVLYLHVPNANSVVVRPAGGETIAELALFIVTGVTVPTPVFGDGANRSTVEVTEGRDVIAVSLSNVSAPIAATIDTATHGGGRVVIRGAGEHAISRAGGLSDVGDL
jgi:hypothetical protein